MFGWRAQTGERRDAVAPNFFIVGAGKAGTTSMHFRLAQHPDVFMCPHKEPRFFARDNPRLRARNAPVVSDEKKYLALFERGRGRRVVGESSPAYMWDPGAATRIQAAVPHAKILIMLRDPVDRAFSHYLMCVEGRTERRGLLQAIEDEIAGDTTSHYLEVGRYADQVARFRNLFPSGQTHVELFEDMKNDPRASLVRVARFLNIDAAPFERVSLNLVYNPYRTPRNRFAAILLGSAALRRAARRALPFRALRFLYDRYLTLHDKPPIDAVAKARLIQIYEPDVARLEDLLGRDLGALRGTWHDMGGPPSHGPAGEPSAS